MVFNSLHFIAFFPIAVISYYLVPQTWQYVWLVLCNYYFYMCWNIKYGILLLGLTTITFIIGLIIHNFQSESQKRKSLYVQFFGICIVVIILIFYKYSNFILSNVGRTLKVTVPPFDIIAPIGISFYSLQMLTYLIDLYRGDVQVEKNFIKYAAFTSFFPSLCSGPIGRAKLILPQINTVHTFDYLRVKNGLLLMVWGVFQKLVISDRIGIFVNYVYGEYNTMPGYVLLFATILYALQIYCDFSGYSDIAVGSAEVLGIELITNFKQPYFSKSVAEFWRKWHISLSSWFRDYVYIPLGGNRKGKWVKYRNILVVFLISGLWHGASWNYILWGALHGAFQIIGDLTKVFREKFKKLLRIRTDCFSYHLFQSIITFCLVDFAWIFFRAPGALAGLEIIYRIIKLDLADFDLSFLNNFGLNTSDFTLLLLSICILLCVDVLRKYINVRESIMQQNLVFRWILYYSIIFIILIFGIYGPGYDAGSFVYMQF